MFPGYHEDNYYQDRRRSDPLFEKDVTNVATSILRRQFHVLSSFILSFRVRGRLMRGGQGDMKVCKAYGRLTLFKGSCLALEDFQSSHLRQKGNAAYSNLPPQQIKHNPPHPITTYYPPTSALSSPQTP